MRQKTHIISRDSTFVLLCAQPRCKTEQRNRESEPGATTLHDGNFDFLDGNPEYQNAPCWRAFHLSKESGGLRNPHTSAQSPGTAPGPTMVWGQLASVNLCESFFDNAETSVTASAAPTGPVKVPATSSAHAYRTTRIVSCSFFPMPRFFEHNRC